MRTITKRFATGIAALAAVSGSVFAGAGAAQAAGGVTCVYNPNPVCHYTPTVSHSYFATSTALDVTPEPAVYSGVNQNTASAPSVSVHGTVKTLNKVGNTASKAGVVKIYFTRNATTASRPAGDSQSGLTGSPVTSTPVFMGTIPVSASGAFSKAIKAPYSGTWRAIYQGNVVKISSVKYTHMYGSTSSGDMVLVQKVIRAAGVQRAADESAGQVTSFTTDNYGFTPGRPVNVQATISDCTGPMGTFTLGVGGDASGSFSYDLDETTYNVGGPFTAGAATNAYVTGLDASCNVEIALWQQRSAQVRYVR